MPLFNPKVNTTSLVILLVTGVVAITASWRLSVDILEESEKRLKNEEAIAGAINNQYLAIQKFKDEGKQRKKSGNLTDFRKSTNTTSLGQYQPSSSYDKKLTGDHTGFRL